MTLVKTLAGWSLTLLVLMPEVGVAQDPGPRTLPPSPPRPRNKIEEFVSRKGVLLVEKMYSIKTFSWGAAQDQRVPLAVSAMQVYEAGHESEGAFGVRFEGQPLEGFPIRALLDLPQAQSLLVALEKMIAEGRENVSKAPEFLEVKFGLGDSLECGFDQQGTVQRPFLTLGADLSRTLRSPHMGDLEDLKVALAADLDKLKELGAR